MGKISNITNSSDPQAVNARIFVGNVNTFALTKEDVEAVFKRYGKIIGISMHKGYAFIQYTNEVESRNAVTGEDQRVYAGQTIDVNLAAEPKPNRANRKRPNGAGAEWDYYYNMPVVPGAVPIQVPLAKRPRPELIPPPLTSIISPGAIVPQLNKHPLVQMAGTNYTKLASPLHHKPVSVGTYRHRSEDPDILICGTCKQIFPDLDKLKSHKRIRCKLRFVCRCENKKPEKQDMPTELTCGTCHQLFTSCWELCQHCQKQHQLNIYVDTTSEPGAGGDTSFPDDPETTPAISTSSALLHLNPTDQDSEDHEMSNHDNGLNSPGSGSLSSDISSVDMKDSGTLTSATTSVKDAQGHPVPAQGHPVPAPSHGQLVPVPDHSITASTLPVRSTSTTSVTNGLEG